MKKKMITVALAAYAIVGVGAEETENVESEVVRYSYYPLNMFTNKTGAASASTCNDLAKDEPSPLTNGVYWSDGLVPHNGATYIAGKINNASTLLWTPIQSVDTTYDMFDALVLEDGCTLCIRHKNKKKAIFNNLRIAGEVPIYGPNVDWTILGGKVFVQSGARMSIRSYFSNEFIVESEISGSGDVLFQTQAGTSASTSYYHCYGMNTNFYGKVTVSMGSTKVNTGTLGGNFSTLTITNAANLGGKLEPYLVNETVPFTYNALRLMKMSKLRVTAPNIVLPADSNRGMFISTYSGRIEVPESAGTLTVNWPITLGNGVHLYKEGTGHLVLGNQLWFCNKNDTFIAAEAAGNDCHYYIDIREGSVSATHCHAMDGAYIAFSNNTEMVMSVDATDENIRKYGIRCDKTRYGSPLATEMPIRLCVSDINNFTESSYKIPLVTVKTVYAEDVASKLKVTLDIKGYRLADITSTVSEGLSAATTFYADILHNGLVISVR